MSFPCSVLVLIMSVYSYYVTSMELSRPKHGFGYHSIRVHQYYCTKLRNCKSSDKSVCGFDEEIPHLAVFADLCTLYKANCKEVGFYQLVDMMVCEMRSSYDKTHPNETFEYIHLITTSPSSPPLDTDKTLTNFDLVTGKVTGVERLVRSDNFAQFHCYKLKTCVSRHVPVCGVHVETDVRAKFNDICTFHGVNCFKQGKYLLSDDEFCKPDIVFLGRSTNKYGSVLDSYDTAPPSTTTTTESSWLIPEWVLTTGPTIAPEFTTTTANPMRKGVSQYSVSDFVLGILDYLQKVL